jgi:hypothetical protein
MHATSTKTNDDTHQPRPSFMNKLTIGQKLGIGRKKVASTTDPSLEMGCESSGTIRNKKLSPEEEDFYLFRLESGELGSQVRYLTPQQSSSPIKEETVRQYVSSEDDFLWSNHH